MSEDLKAEVIRLFEGGMSFADVAKELRLTKGKVAGICSRAGVRRQRSSSIGPLDRLKIFKARKRGIESSKLAKEYGVSRNIIIGLTHRYPREIEADNRDLRILQMIDDGVDPNRIAIAEGITVSHVTTMRRLSEATA